MVLWDGVVVRGGRGCGITGRGCGKRWKGLWYYGKGLC